MTPLIDIVLVVLIIMMVNIPIQVEQMGLKLPSEVQVKPKDKPPSDQLVIAIYSDLTFALNRRLMAEEVLFYEVTRRLRPMSKKNVFIDAHGDIPYGVVVKMMDVAREAGAVQVALARMKDEGPAAATEVDPGAMPQGVTLGSPRVVGAIGEKAADESIQPLMGALRSCYDQQLAVNPELNGRLVISVDVGPEGEIMAHELNSDTVGDDTLWECIDPYIPNLSFEPLGYNDEGEGNTARIHYPVLFSSG